MRACFRVCVCVCVNNYCLLGDYGRILKVLCVQMYVNVVFVKLYSAASLTRVREWRFTRLI